MDDIDKAIAMSDGEGEGDGDAAKDGDITMSDGDRVATVSDRDGDHSERQ